MLHWCAEEDMAVGKEEKKPKVSISCRGGDSKFFFTWALELISPLLQISPSYYVDVRIEHIGRVILGREISAVRGKGVISL